MNQDAVDKVKTVSLTFGWTLLTWWAVYLAITSLRQDKDFVAAFMISVALVYSQRAAHYFNRMI